MQHFNPDPNFDKIFQSSSSYKIVEQEIVDKADTQYVAAQFPHLPNAGIAFLQFIIRLPYQVVKKSQDTRAFLVAKVKERLGEAA